jgi:hypothetical protein
MTDPGAGALQFVFYSAIKEDLVASLGPDRILQDVLVEDPSWDDETRQLWNQAKAANPDVHRYARQILSAAYLAIRSRVFILLGDVMSDANRETHLQVCPCRRARGVGHGQAGAESARPSEQPARDDQGAEGLP